MHLLIYLSDYKENISKIWPKNQTNILVFIIKIQWFTKVDFLPIHQI